MKRTIAMLLTLLMLLSFVACKDKDTTSSSIESTSDSAQAATSNATTDGAGNTDTTESNTDSADESGEVLPSNTETTLHDAVTSGIEKGSWWRIDIGSPL